MDTVSDRAATPPALVDDLHDSKAEIERGEHVPMQPTLDRMQAAIKRIEARKTGTDHRKA